MKIIEQIKEKIKLYKINVTKLFVDLKMNNDLVYFILNAAKNKLNPKDLKVVEIILKEIDKKTTKVIEGKTPVKLTVIRREL